MKKIWITEGTAIIYMVVVIILTGFMFNNWSLTISIIMGGYILWLYYRLLKLEKWLSKGTRASDVYDDSGFFDLLIRHLYKQKKVHNKRKKKTKEILRRLNTNISALPDATVLLNDLFEIEWANKPAQYLLGINPRSDIGQRISNLIRHPKFLRYLIAPDKKKYLEIESPFDVNITLQLKIVRFGKDQRLLTARNISEQNQLQEGLKNFVANASHELKTPLTVISGHLEMLESDPSISKNGQKSIQAAIKQSKRMKHLIQDLLLLSRVESYSLQPHEGETVSITQIMTNTMNSIGKNCDQGNISCEFPDNMYLLGIGSEIEGICINLIDNALKYSDENDSIQITWFKNDNDEYVFSVSDQGSGISEQDLTQITQRYFRGQQATSRQITGSGLGLAIVNQAAIKHGAKLKIKSELDKGSTFSVIFPSYRVLNDSKKNVVNLPYKNKKQLL